MAWLATGSDLVQHAGVSSSSGEVPTTFERMGANAIAFIKALGLKQVTYLASRSGGMVVQESLCRRPISSAADRRWRRSARRSGNGVD